MLRGGEWDARADRIGCAARGHGDSRMRRRAAPTRRPDDDAGSVSPAAAVVKVRGTSGRRTLARRSPLVGWAFSIGGYLFAAFVFAWLAGEGRFTLASFDAGVWDRVGDQVRAGISPYAQTGAGGFFYAPPWALAFALVSWLPQTLVAGGIIVAEIAALRYIGGSWLRVGYLCWCPFVPMELVTVQFNLVMAAALVAAVRGQPVPAVILGLAKLSPFLAIDVRDWRRAAVALVVIVAVTLPFVGLWVEWAGQLGRSYGTNLAPGSQFTIPFLPRLAIAGVLVLTRRPWARVIAAVIAVPAIYNVTLVGFLALVPLLRHGRPSSDPDDLIAEAREGRDLPNQDLDGDLRHPGVAVIGSV